MNSEIAPEIPNGTNTEMNAVFLEEAMMTMERIRSKSIKEAQHEEFLSKCLEAGRIPNGLRIQQTEVHLMNTPPPPLTPGKSWQKLKPLRNVAFVTFLKSTMLGSKQNVRKPVIRLTRGSGQNSNIENRKRLKVMRPSWKSWNVPRKSYTHIHSNPTHPHLTGHGTREDVRPCKKF